MNNRRRRSKAPAETPGTPACRRLANADVDRVVGDTMTAADQIHNPADAGVDIAYITDGKTVVHEPADDSIIAQVHELNVFGAIVFEIPVGVGGWVRSQSE